MTKTTKTIPNPLRTAISTTARYGMLSELHSAGVIPLPDAFVDDLIKAHRFQAKSTEASDTLNRTKTPGAATLGLEALLAATTPEEEQKAAAETWEHEQTIERAQAASATWKAAAGTLVGLLRKDWTPSITGDWLLEARDRIVEEAVAPAQVMAAAVDFDYNDPTAVAQASEPVRAAFAVLVPLARHIDMVTRCAMQTFKDSPSSPMPGNPAAVPWTAIDRFVGLGVTTGPAGFGNQTTWRYEAAEVHPVHRLVQVATAPAEEPADEPVEEPVEKKPQLSTFRRAGTRTVVL